MKIKEVRHMLLGIAVTPTGEAQGGKPVAEVNQIVTEIASGYDEVQTHLVKNALDERGDPSFVLNEYIFIKYEEEVPYVKAKKE